MSWRFKTAVLWILAIPAFSGFPVNQVQGHLMPGAAYGWLGYGVTVHLVTLALLGAKAYRISVIITMLITLPVVLLGAGISFGGLLIRGWDPALQAAYTAHYLSLAITMLAVIPLALSMVAVIPIQRFEYQLLHRKQGVRMAEKIALMFLRVFSHILYFVIPSILEIIREERTFSAIAGGKKPGGVISLPFGCRFRTMVRMLIQVGVEGICAAIRYIPLWAEEISRLPGRTSESRGPDKPCSYNQEKDKT